MTMNLIKGPLNTTPEQDRAAAMPAPFPAAVVHAQDTRPLDWSHVVDAAAARLEESWVRPDTTGHMLASGLAQELAATLCAYGMIEAEIDHMHDHEDAAVTGRSPLPT